MVLLALRIATNVDIPWWSVFVPLLVQCAFIIGLCVVGNALGQNVCD